MFWKKMICVLLCLAFLGSFAACSAAPAGGAADGAAQKSEAKTESGKEIEIEILHNWVGADTNAEIAEKLVSEFNEANQGTYRIKVTGIPEFVNMTNKLKTDVAAGKTPDIFLIAETVKNDGTWLDGQLADLTPYIDEEFKSYKSEDVWNSCTKDGKIVAVANTDLAAGIYYNKEMFEKAGVSIPIKTWDAFYEACDALKAAGFAPLALETLEGWVPMLMFSAFVGGMNGANAWDGLKDFNDPAFLEGAKFLEKLKGYTTQDALGAPYQIAANNFLQEKAAMLCNGPWVIPDVTKQEGLYEKIGMMPFPGYTAENSPIMISGPGQKLCVSKALEEDPDKMAGAIAFLKFFNEPKNSQRFIASSGMILRSNGLELEKEASLDPMLLEFYKYLDEEAVYTVQNARDSVQNGFDVAFSEELGKLWIGEDTPETFVANLNQKVFGA